MLIQFEWRGLTLDAAVHFEPYIPARVSGPPEDCYPASGGCAEIDEIKCGGADAGFLLKSPEIASDLCELAYDACVEQIEREAEQDEYDDYADDEYERVAA